MTDDEIKKNFQILASEVAELKKKQKEENGKVVKFEDL